MQILIGLAAGAAIALFVIMVVQRSNNANSQTSSSDVKEAFAEALAALHETAKAERKEAIDLAMQEAEKQLTRKEESIERGMKAVGEVVKQQVDDLEKEVRQLRESNKESYGNVDQSMDKLAEQTGKLIDVLGNNGSRGQFGERVAEDVIRKAGFIEGISYKREDRDSVQGGRPDFSFEIPPDQILFLDCKFPLDAYKRYIEAGTDAEKKLHLDAFKTAVKLKVTQLQKREYVEKSSRKSIDYVLLFIPNETISNFIQEKYPELVDDALNNKVVFCSPLNLYAFLAIVRQANQTFQTEKATGQILTLLDAFNKQWAEYTKELGGVLAKFTGFQDGLVSVISGTRFKKLGVAVRKMDDLRRKQGIPDAPLGVLDGDDELDEAGDE